MSNIYEQSNDFYECQEILLQQCENELRSDQELQSDNTEQRSDEKIGRPKIENTIRHKFAKQVGPSHYFHSLSKSLLWVYSKLECQESSYDSEHTNRSHQELFQDFTQFIDCKVIFLQALELLTKDNLPSIQEVLKNNTNFEKNYLTQLASRTLGSALRALRLKSDRELKRQKIIELNQTMIKCLFVGSILLIGVGRIKLNIQSKSQNINRKFQRIVIELIRKSKLLNKTTFGYIRQYWDSIIELIVNQQIQKQSVITLEDDQEIKTYQKRQNVNDRAKKEEKNITLEPSSKRMVDQNSSQQISEYYFVDQYEGHLEGYYYQEDSLDAYFPEEFQFSSSKKSSNKSSSDIDSKQEKIMIQQFSQELQRQKRLKKRAKQIFNYQKQKRKRKPSNKQKQAPKTSKKSKKQKKPKKPHPPHKMRQIDILVNFIIKDQFCIAHAIANHISNALIVENMRLKQY